MTIQTAASFIGWWRPCRGSPWTQLAEGATYDDALERLIAALASVHGGDSLVTRADADPNHPARAYRSGGRRRL